jgi:hypothetical protein
VRFYISLFRRACARRRLHMQWSRRGFALSVRDLLFYNMITEKRTNSLAPLVGERGSDPEDPFFMLSFI